MQEVKCRSLVRGRAILPFDEWHDALSMLPCERCGVWTNSFELHHRQFRSRGGVWIPSNVVLLCHLCHLGATNEAPWIEGTGLNVHSWEEPTEVPVQLWHTVNPVFLDDDGGWEPAPLDKG